MCGTRLPVREVEDSRHIPQKHLINGHQSARREAGPSSPAGEIRGGLPLDDF